MKYWLGVVSKEHVLKGVEGGFAQVCHGKKIPLMKLHKGDGFVYYSPKISMYGSEACKRFTAIGRVRDGNVYQVEMTPDFHPFRIDIDYLPSHEIEILSLLDRLELTQKKSWGIQLRHGLIEITKSDFYLIASFMGVLEKLI